MNHRHRKILHALFAHPVSANITMRDIEAVFRELGAELGHTHAGKLVVEIDGHKVSFHSAHHTVPKDEVQQIRRFLEARDIVPERDYPL